MQKPPPARIDIVRDTYFGTTIDDPYRWMEDYRDNPELTAWIEAQAAHTREYLAALPERDKFLARLTELNAVATRRFNVKLAGDMAFYQRLAPDANIPVLCVRPANGDRDERVVFDPADVGGAVHTSIDWYEPAPDGKHVALATSPGGSEDSTLHILNVADGTPLDTPIPRTVYAKVRWLDDSRAFFYSRSPDITPDSNPTDYYNYSRIYLHRLGTDLADDPVVLGIGHNPEVEFAPIDIPSVHIAQNSDWLLGVVQHGDANEVSVHLAPRDALDDLTALHWEQVADMGDAITHYGLYGDTVYLLTHKDAPRYKIVAVAATAPTMVEARVVVPESEAVIQNFIIVDDYLIVHDTLNGVARLWSLHLVTGNRHMAPLPFDGAIYGWSGNEAQVVFALTNWTNSMRFFCYDLAAGTVEDTGWQPPSPIDFSDVESHEVLAPGKDGTPIPLSIIHKQGLKLDGDNPTILWGYGSYGISFHSGFIPHMLAWFERGGVFALAHIRGGGENGKDWHQDGRFLKKGNTIEDFIACGEYLVEKGYTRPGRLAGQGGSGGGIPTGGALVRRPDLFTVMVMNVAVTNTLRMELTENGPPNIMEFGSVTTEDGFKGLLITDSYQRVQDGVEYPAVLLTSGLNDPRVVVWMATKMAARLQAATASDRPILLRIEEQAGHGIGSTKSQKELEQADMFALLWEQFGMDG